MARYTVTLSDADAASLDSWLAAHSNVILRSYGGTHSWHPVAVQKQGRTAPRKPRALPAIEQVPEVFGGTSA